jgi:hypothetical protein
MIGSAVGLWLVGRYIVAPAANEPRMDSLEGPMPVRSPTTFQTRVFENDYVHCRRTRIAVRTVDPS